MIEERSLPRPRRRCGRRCAACSSSRRRRSTAWRSAGTPRRARPSSPCAASTRAAAGRSGRRASSSAPPSSSSTPPATARFLEIGRDATVRRMASHLTHVGVHDHGFNNVSTYGNLLRLMHEGRLPEDPWESALLRARAQGERRGAGRALDAPRGPTSATSAPSTGPHSLFADTIRSLRALALAHQLGHVLMGEGDRPDLAPRPPAPARGDHRALQRLFRRRPRRLRRARARRPRVRSST